MIFKVSRTSEFDRSVQPCAESSKKVIMYRDIPEERWAVEIATLRDLQKLIKEYGKVILSEGDLGGRGKTRDDIEREGGP